MADVKEFLSWFSGFAENIEGAPTEKQWERVKAKIAELEVPVYAGAPFPPPPVVTPPAPLAKPTNATQWRAQYQGALIELGADMESAKEFAASVPVDLNVSPKAQAEQDIGPMLN